jgi:hypothetical protein
VGPEGKRQVLDVCGEALLGCESEIKKYTAVRELLASGLLPPPSEKKLEELREEFLESLDWMLDLSDFSDYSSAVDAIGEVESAARTLGLDVSDEVEKATEKAHAIREPDFDEQDEEPPSRTPDSSTEDLSDADIDEIFSGLEKQ